MVDDSLALYAQRLASIDAGSVPSDVTGRRIADTIAAFVAGRTTRDGRLAANASGSAVATPRDPAAFAAAIRHTEIDDIHLATCITAGAIVVSTALAAAVEFPVDGATLRRGIAAGYATAMRFGQATGGVAALREGAWPTLALAPVVAAAVTGVMRGMAAEPLAHALRIALLRSVARAGRAATPSARWYLFGVAVAAGIDAAKAAAAGLAVEATAPFPYTLDEELAALPIGDGSMETVSQKPFCTSRQTLSAIVAFADMLRDGIDVAAITRVRVDVPHAYAWMIGGDARPGERLSSITSQRFQIAAAAVDPTVLFDIERIGPFNPAIEAFARCVEVAGTNEFDLMFPHRWPARVTIERSSGAERTRLVEEPLGDPSAPLSFADLQRKSPVYSKALHAACLIAPDEGPAELLAALTMTPEGS